MLKSVIFDFDGVIVDSEKWHWRGFNDILAGFDINLSWQEYCDSYLGYTDSELLEKVFSERQIEYTPEKIALLVSEKAVIFGNLARQSTETIDGIMGLLDLLSENKISTAICSGASSCDIDAMLCGTGIENRFSVIVSADDVEKGKPDPAGYLLTLEKLKAHFGMDILHADCVVIEDSHWGIEAGIAAGMNVVAVTNNYSAEELKMAQKVVANLKELTIEDLQSLCG